jgi:restriction endonuclease
MRDVPPKHVDFQRATRHYIAKDRNLHEHRCDNSNLTSVVPTSKRDFVVSLQGEIPNSSHSYLYLQQLVQTY